VYVEGITEKECANPGRNGISTFEKDCEAYEDADERYPYCEVAWGCYRKGFEKKPALHRTCSMGPAYAAEAENGTNANDTTSDQIPCEKIESGVTADGNFIFNLQACFCDKDYCNYPHSRAGEISQAKLLKTVCARNVSPVRVTLNPGLMAIPVFALARDAFMQRLFFMQII
jgi:hypothetical protein